MLPGQGQGLLSLAGSPPAAGGGPAYLVNQGFEGSSPDYDNGESSAWNNFAGGGGIDPNYSTPFSGAGSHALQITASGNSAAAYRDFTNNDTVCLVFYYRLDSVTGSSEILTLHSNGTANFNGYLQITVGGTMRISSGGQANETSSTIPGTTNLWLWVEISKGTGSGSDGSMKAGWSTTSTKPTLSASGSTTCAVAGSSLTAQTGRVYLGTTATTTAISQVYDAVLIDTSPLP